MPRAACLNLPIVRPVAPGVRLHLLRTDRFTTTVCRVVLHRDLGPEATATSLLGQVLQSATARHPTREALARRLADLYGAALHVTVAKAGDRQLLTGSLEWPTAHVPRARGLLAKGLELLREVWSEPLRRARGARAGPLDPDLVATERVNLVRMLRALEDDKYRHALARCVAATCRDEPHGLEVLGRVEDAEGVTAEDLGTLHARLLSRAPVDVFLVGDLGPREAVDIVRRHLLWEGRAARPFALPSATSVRRPRSRPRRIVEHDRVNQAQFVAAYRAPVQVTSPLAPAALTLAGILGGGSYGRLFQVVRETHGLCYFEEATWNPAKGLLLVHIGTDPEDEPRVRRLVHRLVGEVAGGVLDPAAHRGLLEAVATAAAALGDDRATLLGWHQYRAMLGLDPSPARHLDALRRVTPAQVRRVGRGLGLDVTYVLTRGGKA